MLSLHSEFRMESLLLFFISTLVLVSAQDCSHDFTKHDDYCYGFIRQPLSWHDAGIACSRIQNGYLAEPMTQNENSFIFGLVRSHGGGKAWLGGSDLLNEGRWFWSHSGQSFDWTYSAWYGGGPDNANGNQHCLQVYDRGYNLWDDNDCSVKYNYVCEYRLSELVNV